MNKKPRLLNSTLCTFKISSEMLRHLKVYQSHCSHPSLSYSIRQILKDHLTGGTGSIGHQMELDRKYEKAFGHKP